MSRDMIDGRLALLRTSAWPLELEMEICPGARRAVTAETLRLLTAHLNHADGVRLATAEAHGTANLIRVCVTVDAYDLYDAIDRVSSVVRECLSCTGLGIAILVAARAAPEAGTSHRTA